MKNRKKSPARLPSLLDNHLVQFLLGLFSIALFIQIAGAWENVLLKVVFKTIGYVIFYYLATPFLLYWLTYVSVEKLTRLKVAVTIFLVAIYSYIFWDSYFFYKLSLGDIFFSDTLI